MKLQRKDPVLFEQLQKVCLQMLLMSVNKILKELHPNVPRLIMCTNNVNAYNKNNIPDDINVIP